MPNITESKAAAPKVQRIAKIKGRPAVSRTCFCAKLAQ